MKLTDAQKLKRARAELRRLRAKVKALEHQVHGKGSQLAFARSKLARVMRVARGCSPNRRAKPWQSVRGRGYGHNPHR